MSDNRIRLDLSSAEALVLFEWISRFNEAENTSFDDPAEQRALWLIEGRLESSLVEPFAANYRELLARAREVVRGEEQ